VSEFSESFHLFHSDIESVKAILRTCRASAVIAGANHRWVSFVLLDPSGEAPLLRASRGILARYHYGSDHGLLLTFYRDGQWLGDLILKWDPNEGRISDDLASALVRAEVLDRDGEAALVHLLEEVRTTRTGESFRDRTAGLFGFPAYARLSADACLGIDADDLRSLGYELFEP
jgi:hypothetical protein